MRCIVSTRSTPRKDLPRFGTPQASTFRTPRSCMSVIWAGRSRAIEMLYPSWSVTLWKVPLRRGWPGLESRFGRPSEPNGCLASSRRDFFVPTEVAPAAIIEAKITGDDGTARDKVSRVLNLATMRDNRERAGQATFELIACVDGRGFRVRREDMRKMLLATRGKVFTLATLDRLIEHTRLREFLPRPS